jgi:flagellar biosynthesis protein
MSRGPQPRALAVALAYEPGESAPVVVASGRGHIGEKIIEIARENGVPLEENPALAEALSAVELDTEIPEELYTAVAEIIGFVLRASGRIR